MDIEYNTNTGYNPSPSYTNYCGNRLPCGFCRITGQLCYDHSWQPSITWTASTAGPSGLNEQSEDK